MLFENYYGDENCTAEWINRKEQFEVIHAVITEIINKQWSDNKDKEQETESIKQPRLVIITAQQP